MQYNTKKGKLLLTDYGRIVQDLVAYAKTIEEREERNSCARTIVRTMAKLTESNLQNPDEEHKLWNHLAEIADYSLDIDWPVKITPKEEREQKPEPLPHIMQNIKRRQYGHNVEEALAKLSEMGEGEEREAITGLLANHMRWLLNEQGADTRNEERVAADIAQYTEGAVELNENFRFSNANRSVQGSNAIASLHNSKKKKKKK